MDDGHSFVRRLDGGALLVTVVVFLLFGLAMAETAWRSEQAAFDSMVETLKALAMVAGGYWLGSSQSSARKDQTIADASQALASSTPVIDPTAPPPATTPVTTPPYVGSRS